MVRRKSDTIMLPMFIIVASCLSVIFVHADGQDLALQLLFANQKDIKLVDVPNIQRKDHLNVTTLTRDLEVAATVDYVYNEQLIIWSDISSETIRGMRLNDSRTFDVITSGIMSPDGVRCDWLTKKLYWLDSETNRIEVAQFDGSNRKVLYWQEFDQPRGIALVPDKGLIFWTDWGEVPKIERASMDGEQSSRIVIVDKNIEWPNGLTVDYETEIMYWVDAKLQKIESATLDGLNRQTILNENIPHPFAIAVHKDYLFWTDWINKSVNLCNKTNGKNRRELIPVQNQLHPMDIHVFSRDRQPHHPTPCDHDNGGCSHLCLLSHDSRHSSLSASCACPTGIQLLPDQKTCASKAENLLIIARQSDIRQLSLDTPDYTHSVLNVRGVKHAIAVDYDVLDERVFWTDDDAHVIRSVFLNGSHQVDIANVDVEQPEGLAIDWVARNLYWTDTGSDRIEVARLNGSFRKVLVSEGLSEPRAIAVFPERGFFYWTDWGQQPKIERAALDGSMRQEIVNTTIKWPNSLTIDYDNDRIYWCDAYHDVIETASLTGTDRHVLVSEQLPHVFSVSVLDDWVYWTDWSQRSVERVNKVSGGSRELIVDQLPDMMALKATHTHRSKLRGTNGCAYLNGNCSQLCLFTPEHHVSSDATIGDNSASSYCHCSTGFKLHPDRRTCDVDENYVPEQRTRKPSEGRARDRQNNSRKACQQNNGGCSHQCLQTQDGKGRKCGCPDDLVLAEDEKTCIPQPSPCSKDQFQCKTSKGECIPEGWICDGVAECSDKSDEENCPECPPTHYRCPDSRYCLHPTKICDNSPDCPDGSDELCCSLHEFVCRPENRKECIHSNYVCDGNVDCKNSADEDSKNCHKTSVADKTITITNSHPPNSYFVLPVCFVLLFVIVVTVCFFRKRRVVIEEPDILLTHPLNDRFPDARSLGKDSTLMRSRLQLNPNSCPVQRSTSDHIFERAIATGASSTSSSANHFPKETLNPPPSPATDRSQCHYDTSCSSHSATRSSSHAASLVLFPGHHSMHKRLLLRGPPTTPCSNDPNEESDYYGTVPYSYSNSQVDYDIMYPPLTTPLNVSEASTPPSPCTERSYFRSNPYPNPPPSPDPSNHP